MPAIAAYIHEENSASRDGSVHIPLAGIAVGDGWIDPVNMVPGYPDLVWFLQVFISSFQLFALRM